jgi:hypothetical protein
LAAETKLAEDEKKAGRKPGNPIVKTLEYFWNQFKEDLKKMGEKAKAELTGLFEQFKSFLTIKDERQFLPETGRFVEKLFTSVRTVVTDLTKFIGLPKLLAELTGVITGASIIPLLTPPVIGFAAVNLGARKLFEWLLPELILGAGSVGSLAGAPDAKGEEANGILTAILDALKKIAGVAAGGLIGALVKDEKKREQIRAILEKVGDVAGKVEKSLGGVLALSQKVAKGNFDEVERVLTGAAVKAAPEEISAGQFQKMIGALLDFAGEQIWALLNQKLRDLVGKGLSLFDKLFGLLRGAMVGGVGSIPFVGGVLGFALGLGLDLVVDLVKGFLIDQVLMPLAKFVLDDVIEGMKKELDRRFFASAAKAPGPADSQLTDVQRRIRIAVGRNQSLKALAGMMGDSVDEVRHALRTASIQHRKAVASLATTALKDVMLRGVASARVREMVGGALAAMAPMFANPGSSLRQGIGAVLRRVERPLRLLLGRSLPNPRIREILRDGLAGLVREAGAGEAAARLGRSQSGVLGQLAIDLIAQVRPRLAALLVGSRGSPAIRRIVETELRVLARVVRRDGFAALLALGEHLHGAVARAARSAAYRVVAAQADPAARLALFQELDAVAGQVASRVLGGRAAGKGLWTVLGETATRWAVDSVARGTGGGR